MLSVRWALVLKVVVLVCVHTHRVMWALGQQPDRADEDGPGSCDPREGPEGRGKEVLRIRNQAGGDLVQLMNMETGGRTQAKIMGRCV